MVEGRAAVGAEALLRQQHGRSGLLADHDVDPHGGNAVLLDEVMGDHRHRPPGRRFDLAPQAVAGGIAVGVPV